MDNGEVVGKWYRIMEGPPKTRPLWWSMGHQCITIYHLQRTDQQNREKFAQKLMKPISNQIPTTHAYEQHQVSHPSLRPTHSEGQNCSQNAGSSEILTPGNTLRNPTNRCDNWPSLPPLFSLHSLTVAPILQNLNPMTFYVRKWSFRARYVPEPSLPHHNQHPQIDISCDSSWDGHHMSICSLTFNLEQLLQGAIDRERSGDTSDGKSDGHDDEGENSDIRTIHHIRAPNLHERSPTSPQEVSKPQLLQQEAITAIHSATTHLRAASTANALPLPFPLPPPCQQRTCPSPNLPLSD